MFDTVLQFIFAAKYKYAWNDIFKYNDRIYI